MKHAMIPDTQIFPGSETKHIDLAAKYLRRHKPDKIRLVFVTVVNPNFAHFSHKGWAQYRSLDTNFGQNKKDDMVKWLVRKLYLKKTPKEQR